MKRLLEIVGYRRVFYVLSALLLAASAGAFFGWGLKLGIDFTGGSLMEVNFSKERPAIQEIDAAIPDDLGQAHVTPLGDTSIAVRMRELTNEEHQTVLESLRAGFQGSGEMAQDIREDRFTSIGPTIGAELQRKAIWAILTVMAAIILYIAWAFRKVSRPVASWQYGVVAIIALFHDVFIPVGIFSALGKFAGVEIDTLFITALLTVLGFSVHDTIVVFDRIRENLLKSGDRFQDVVNRSVNETIARSINTSLTTLLVLVTTFLFGGESIRYFVLTLILGIIFGTYSSIFIASPLLVTWQKLKTRK